jgi:hypothetical protein
MARSRAGFVQMRDDERKGSAVAFLQAAVAPYAALSGHSFDGMAGSLVSISIRRISIASANAGPVSCLRNAPVIVPPRR